MTEPKKIIIVDDNTENLTAIKNTLKDHYEVYPSNSAFKMFELLEHITPDLILLDVEMPEISGYEAAKRLKSNGKLREIPIIFLTNMIDAKSEITGLNIGAIDYIHKPFVAPLLLRRIKTHLSLIEHQQDALSASRAKGEFLSHMSHEIRTPLNAIIGMINIAGNTDDISKIKYCLQRAGSASKHLLNIINDILDMSKIEANKFELAYSEFNFEKMLMDIINITNVHAEEKNLNFAVILNTNVPSLLVGDELRLSQVIMNLLNNAIKFTPENGKVVLRVEKTEENDDEITLKTEVADSGIGMTEEQQKRLFSAYSQADTNIYKNFGGSGLGLVISKQIIELMNGEIWIESKPNVGSKFIFTIKVRKGFGKEDMQLSPKINKDDLRILAVDDSEETRMYFTHVMAAFHLPCDIACSGKEALEMMEKAGNKPYNLFFIDWQMPEMDGIKLAKKIKEITGDKSFIIMLSMADWRTIEREAIAAGVRHFIPKPIFPSTLINTINECIEIKPKDGSGKTDKSKESGFDFEDYTILVAEDVEINREILSSILEETGISIDFAQNGTTAVNMFQMYPDKYDLILMDLNMPEMDGYEATQAIRSLELTQAGNICIIAMTANVFREDIEKCMAAGMNDHIGKPIAPESLYEKLRKYLKKKEHK
ncbi:MAG: response regulator [Treponema sp.]|jgi:CheY-like chemotaxis protein|nr:response regulator [Treponema sp.]